MATKSEKSYSSMKASMLLTLVSFEHVEGPLLVEYAIEVFIWLYLSVHGKFKCDNTDKQTRFGTWKYKDKYMPLPTNM